MENFGEKLYQLRTQEGKYVSQQKLAKLSSYTQTYISLIETGKVKASKRCQEALLQALKEAQK
jgi:predicted transcriptional regulator